MIVAYKKRASRSRSFHRRSSRTRHIGDMNERDKVGAVARNLERSVRCPREPIILSARSRTIEQAATQDDPLTIGSGHQCFHIDGGLRD